MYENFQHLFLKQNAWITLWQTQMSGFARSWIQNFLINSRVEYVKFLNFIVAIDWYTCKILRRRALWEKGRNVTESEVLRKSLSLRSTVHNSQLLCKCRIAVLVYVRLSKREVARGWGSYCLVSFKYSRNKALSIIFWLYFIILPIRTLLASYNTINNLISDKYYRKS